MLFVGDDWAEDHHDIEIVDEDGMVLARRRLPEGLVGVTRLHGLIAEKMPAECVNLDPAEAAERVKTNVRSCRDPDGVTPPPKQRQARPFPCL